MGSMNLQSLMGPGAWEHYRPDATDEEIAAARATIASDIGQAMNDWDSATDEQRADALAKAAALADAVPMTAGRRHNRVVTDDTDMCNGCEDSCEGCVSNAVCVMDWDRCTEKLCDLYASGCPHFTEEES